MHESTVSRVVSNKYIHTPRGLFPMKFFFHSGIDREYGEDISSLTVKRKIEKLIQAEDPKKPLSDSALKRSSTRRGSRSRAARSPSTATSWDPVVDRPQEGVLR
jgi:RNA polymerase sigma-54 factor